MGANVEQEPHFILWEEMEGNLGEYLRKHPQPSSEFIGDLASDILEGLIYLNEKGLVYRDLNPSNIWLKNHEDRLVAKLSCKPFDFRYFISSYSVLYFILFHFISSYSFFILLFHFMLFICLFMLFRC